MFDVEELEILTGELRGDQVDDDMECARQLRVRAGDEDQKISRVLGVADSTGPGEPGCESSFAFFVTKWLNLF